jgi:Protein of unknown function (DUF2490)
MRRRVFFFVSNIVLLFTIVPVAFAQESVWEFWPEVDMWYRHSSRWRYSLFIPVSNNLETKYREGNLILQGDYIFGKTRVIHRTRLLDESRAQILRPFMIRGGYLHGRSLDDKGEAYNENMLFLEFHIRTPLKKKYLLSHRLRPEARWLGEDHTYSMRLRYRFMAEKEYELKTFSLVPFVNVEPYYDSRYTTINRVRAIGGATVAWKSRYALEGNFTYQHDTRSSVTNLYAVNIILHIFFERKKSRESTSYYQGMDFDFSQVDLFKKTD